MVNVVIYNTWMVWEMLVEKNIGFLLLHVIFEHADELKVVHVDIFRHLACVKN